MKGKSLMTKKFQPEIQPGLHSWLIIDLSKKIEKHESVIRIYYLYLLAVSLLPGKK